MSTTTHPPTLAEYLRAMSRQPSAWIVHAPLLTHAPDVLGLLAPSTVEMAYRVLAETLPDGWTATVSAYVVLTHDDGRKIVASYRGEPPTERFTWWGACAPTDDDPDRQVSANTLAELIEAVTS